MHLSLLSSFIDLCDGLLSSCCSTRSLLSQLPFLLLQNTHAHTHTHGAYWELGQEECVCCCVYDEMLLSITSSSRWERQIAEVDWRSNLPLLLYLQRVTLRDRLNDRYIRPIKIPSVNVDGFAMTSSTAVKWQLAFVREKKKFCRFAIWRCDPIRCHPIQRAHHRGGSLVK